MKSVSLLCPLRSIRSAWVNFFVKFYCFFPNKINIILLIYVLITGVAITGEVSRGIAAKTLVASLLEVVTFKDSVAVNSDTYKWREDNSSRLSWEYTTRYDWLDEKYS